MAAGSACLKHVIMEDLLSLKRGRAFVYVLLFYPCVLTQLRYSHKHNCEHNELDGHVRLVWPVALNLYSCNYTDDVC